MAGWPTNTLTTAPCPGLFFSRSKYGHCAGEVFRIYGQRSGVIRVGDKVGLILLCKGEKMDVTAIAATYTHVPGDPLEATVFKAEENRDNSAMKCIA